MYWGSDAQPNGSGLGWWVGHIVSSNPVVAVVRFDDLRPVEDSIVVNRIVGMLLWFLPNSIQKLTGWGKEESKE